ncbi:MAG TPA: hypothetical protein VJ672_10655 [Gemmatimonadaceae bacterium]|nr:hypothetical protein [Gemmatimonadaceae bacterium]
MSTAQPDAATIDVATTVRSATRQAVLAGGVAGLAAALTFATAHAIIIVPIWNRMGSGILSAVLGGLAAGWAFAELGFIPRGQFSRGVYAAAGARYGALLWLAVVPVTLVDTVLRLTGFTDFAELGAVAIAVTLAIGAGALLGDRRVGSNRARIAGAAATLMLTIAMAGPVPLPNGARAIGIFLAVLPACIVAGVVLAVIVRETRARFDSLPHEPGA